MNAGIRWGRVTLYVVVIVASVVGMVLVARAGTPTVAPVVEQVDTAPGVPFGDEMPPLVLNPDGTLPVSGPPTE